jgi:hypothetical protein
MVPREPSEPEDDDDPLAASLRRNLREEVAGRMLIPALILMVLSVLSFLALAGFLVFLFAMLILHPPRRADDITGLIISFGAAGVLLVVKGFILLGAVQMARMRMYPIAMAAAILQIVTCSPCWIVDTPIAVWALVILVRPEVREAFYAEDR